jgi:hypothetical protein
MSVLGFFEDVNMGLVTGATPNREYVRFLARYENSGHVTGTGISYQLTDEGRKFLKELRDFGVVVAGALEEDRYGEIDI